MRPAASGGWVKLYRSTAAHPLWLREPFTIGQAWVDLLLRANYRDSVAIRGNRRLLVRRGQVLTSIASLSPRWARDRKTVRAWLLVFETDGMLARESAFGPAGGYTLLTLRNYEAYQAEAGEHLDSELATETAGASASALAGAPAGALPQYEEGEEGKEDEEGEEVRLRDRIPSNGYVSGPHPQQVELP